MKRILIVLALVFVAGVLMTACSSSRKSNKSCPAYGEHQQYQRESVY